MSKQTSKQETTMKSLFGIIGTDEETGENFRIMCEKVANGRVFGVWLVGGPNSGVGMWVEFKTLTNLRREQ